jgi:archaellum component FlaC
VYTTTGPDQEQFNNLLEEVKTMQEESDKLKKLIEDLKSANEELAADKNSLEVKLNQK